MRAQHIALINNPVLTPVSHAQPRRAGKITETYWVYLNERFTFVNDQGIVQHVYWYVTEIIDGYSILFWASYIHFF